MAITGNGFTVTFIGHEMELRPPSVTTTVYSPVTVGLYVAAVAPLISIPLFLHW